ncbi:hypothetical protein FB565_005078 [Actinoplanes lutulentus]|uniref:YbaB/EbfC DNA-binding family protein n=1 Tax=Actinoplanes lutulentus TaxID=1287878 RepID=A0A327ZNN3_9ACTN|nr:hypothetical protein [Actinoplanes lutulentus]MBB2945345.1 hypothetical protein [Actinoplanes lutulentus]RAK40521.1 hypothetical protein B0I29_103559 [Actinoplanes lutulentus]
MQPDLTQRLQRIQQRVNQLGQLTRELASAAPEESEGYDASGCVLVLLGRDGLPVDIRVRDQWQERLEPEELGSAVLDASSAAGQAATRAWAGSLDNSRWWTRQRDADEYAGEANSQSREQPSGLGPGRPQPDGEFNEQVMRALRESVDQASRPQPADDTDGVDGGHHVAVRLNSGGLTECFIEPQWARNRTGGTITEALSTALWRARHGLPSAAHRSAELDALVSDALATLTTLVQRSSN